MFNKKKDNGDKEKEKILEYVENNGGEEQLIADLTDDEVEGLWEECVKEQSIPEHIKRLADKHESK